MRPDQSTVIVVIKCMCNGVQNYVESSLTPGSGPNSLGEEAPPLPLHLVGLKRAEVLP